MRRNERRMTLSLVECVGRRLSVMVVLLLTMMVVVELRRWSTVLLEKLVDEDAAALNGLAVSDEDDLSVGARILGVFVADLNVIDARHLLHVEKVGSLGSDELADDAARNNDGVGAGLVFFGHDIRERFLVRALGHIHRRHGSCIDVHFEESRWFDILGLLLRCFELGVLDVETIALVGKKPGITKVLSSGAFAVVLMPGAVHSDAVLVVGRVAIGNAVLGATVETILEALDDAVLGEEDGQRQLIDTDVLRTRHLGGAITLAHAQTVQAEAAEILDLAVDRVLRFLPKIVHGLGA